MYLKSDPEEEIWIRKRGENGHFVFYETHKKSLIRILREVTYDTAYKNASLAEKKQ